MKISEKSISIIIGVLTIILFTVIISAFIYAKRNKKYSFNDLEKKVVSLSKGYYTKNKLPKLNKSKTITLTSLKEKNKIKEFKLKDGTICSGEVEVYNNNNNFLYTPNIKCGKKETTFLKNVILDNEDIKLSGHGLYKQGNKLIYKGENLNNHLEFNGTEWQILGINEDNSIRLISLKPYGNSKWDDRFNIKEKYNAGINEYERNNINSRVKDSLEKIYKEFPKKSKAYLVPYNMCIGSKHELDTKNQECNKIHENTYVGLITPYEVINVSLDKNCKTIEDKSCFNYNFLKDLPATWTITPVSGTTDKVYYSFQQFYKMSAYNYYNLLIVVNLSDKIIYQGGDGSQDNPYIVN